MPAKTIDEVIDALDAIIADARRHRSRLGYFPAMYRLVTIKVREGIQAGRFEDGDRMTRFEVAFANLYLDRVSQVGCDERPCRCWTGSFDAAKAWRPLILQHLLLGMNAHINYDLGVAAAMVCPGDELPSLKRDFDEINTILAGLVDQVKSEINSVSPWLGMLDRIAPREGDAIINFSMERARAAAWSIATRLAAIEQAEWAAEVEQLDAFVSTLGRLIRHPGARISAWLLLIRIRESNNVPKVIDVLNRTSPAIDAGSSELNSLSERQTK